mgnify:FL=1
MARTPRRTLLDQDLQQLEAELQLLSLRVRQLREEQGLLEDPLRAPPKELQIGDRVRFRSIGIGRKGTIVAITAQRVRIQLDGSANSVLRAPHNVTVISRHVGRASSPATAGRGF